MGPNEIKYGDVFWIDFSRVFPIAKNKHYQKGRRMAVVVSNDKNNEHCDLIGLIPLTTKKDHLPQHTRIRIFGIDNYVLSEQIVTISKEFLIKKVLSLNEYNVDKVKQSMRIQFNLW